MIDIHVSSINKYFISFEWRSTRNHVTYTCNCEKPVDVYLTSLSIFIFTFSSLFTGRVLEVLSHYKNYNAAYYVYGNITQRLICEKKKCRNAPSIYPLPILPSITARREVPERRSVARSGSI
jgi:hypothetical protein